MDLSVVIVNYNVKHFIEQCLHSVRVALKGIEGEVFVVDNNSVDGSVPLIRKKFPWVSLIENNENLGFARANNQAIKKACGSFILLLNPDTIVEEETFKSCLKFMDSHPEAGAIGVKMIDGKGRFLPESKRGLPTPVVAFYKMSGLSGLLPRSERFNRYYLGHLDPELTHEVDVLTGAFMFIRKSVLELTGILDEDYFMYGEDIDLSYRIRKKGFKNYYLPETTIIHYKGESTRKGSLNYVALFYKAMIIFYQKHLTPGKSPLISLFILGAIFFRGLLSAAKRFIKIILLPVLDLVVMLTGYEMIIYEWGQLKLEGPTVYPELFTHIIAPIYVMIWVFGIFFSGGYRIPYRFSKLFRGLAFSSIFLLAAYALLPLHLRFSRALILIGSLWALISATGLRMLFRAVGGHFIYVYKRQGNRILVLAGQKESERISKLLHIFNRQPALSIFTTPLKTGAGPIHLGAFHQIPEFIRFYNINEIIFSGQDVPAEQIISVMTKLSVPGLDFMVAPPESMSVIGSRSKHHSGEHYFQELNSVNTSRNKSLKRSIDILASLIVIIGSPLLLLLVKNKRGLYKNAISVLSGKMTWVGLSPHQSESLHIEELKKLPAGVLTPSGIFSKHEGQEEIEHSIALHYMQNYRFQDDLRIMFRNLRKLGSPPF